MTRTSLSRLVPDASQALREILDGSRGAVEPPNRSEIFGPERFAQHGLSLAETHRAQTTSGRSAAFFPRLQDNIRVLRQSELYIAAHAHTGYQVSPAAGPIYLFVKEFPSRVPDLAGWIWAMVDVPVERYFGPAEKINITVPARVLVRIDDYAKRHGESRSGFLVRAAQVAMAS